MKAPGIAQNKTGAFTNWTEDEEAAELRLPLPEGTGKHDLKVVITPTSLSVTLRSDSKPLLVVNPLAARVVSDETTWFLEEGFCVITLAKMQGVGSSDAAQIWGASLGSPGATFQCYLTPAQVDAAVRRADPKKDVQPSSSGWTVGTAAAAFAVLAVAVAILLLPWMSE